MGEWLGTWISSRLELGIYVCIYVCAGPHIGGVARDMDKLKARARYICMYVMMCRVSYGGVARDMDKLKAKTVCMYVQGLIGSHIGRGDRHGVVCWFFFCVVH